MNEKDITEYFKKLDTLGLATDAKMRMREELSAFADFHTVTTQARTGFVGTQQNSLFSWFSFTHSRMVPTIALIVLVFGVSSGSHAAQKALPGDVLYPVKIHVTEAVRGALIFDANKKAAFELSLLDERLDEAKHLQATQKLKGSTETSVLAAVAIQVDRAIDASSKADTAVASDTKRAVARSLSLFSSRLAIAPTRTADSAHTSTRSMQTVAMKGAQSAGISSDAMTMSAYGASMEEEVMNESNTPEAHVRLELLQKTLAEASGVEASVRSDLEAKLRTAAEYLKVADTDMQARTQAESRMHIVHQVLDDVEASLRALGLVYAPQEVQTIEVDMGSIENLVPETLEMLDPAVDTDILLMQEGAASMEVDVLDTEVRSFIEEGIAF
jgi:hypothetical protein